MPALPTLTVTQAQADRLIAAFGSAAEYKAWLKENIVALVVQKEAQAALAQAEAAYAQANQNRKAAYDALAADLANS